MTTLETELQNESLDGMFNAELDDLKRGVIETTKKEQSNTNKSVEKKKLISMKEVVEQFNSQLMEISSEKENLHVRLDKKSVLKLEVHDAFFNNKKVKVIDIIKDIKGKYTTKETRIWLFYDESTGSFYMSNDEGNEWWYFRKIREWKMIDSTHARKYLNRIWEYKWQARDQRNEQRNEEVNNLMR